MHSERRAGPGPSAVEVHQRPTSRALRALTRLRRVTDGQALAVAIAAIAAIATVDALTGDLLQLSLFYLIAIGFAGWTGSRRIALLVAVLAAVAAMAVALVNADDTVPARVVIFNGTFRAVFFVAFGLGTNLLRSAADELDRRSTHDELTGLYNRRAFYELASSAAFLGGDAAPASMVFIDVDGLKLVNDTEGHEAGDELLQDAAATIRDHVRPTDLLARVGGDEFVALLPRTDEATARGIVERLQAALQSNGRRALSASCGVAAWSTQLPQVDVMVAKADQLMYAAKQEQKGSFRVEVVGSPSTGAG